MTVAISEWGPRLYAHLEAYWRAAGTTANEWAGTHAGVEGPTLSRWKNGVTTPRLETMLPVAEALGVSMLDLLIAAGVIDSDEVNRVTIEAALLGDPALTDLQRRTLTEMLAALREAEGSGVSTRRRKIKG